MREFGFKFIEGRFAETGWTVADDAGYCSAYGIVGGFCGEDAGVHFLGCGGVGTAGWVRVDFGAGDGLEEGEVGGCDGGVVGVVVYCPVCGFRGGWHVDFSDGGDKGDDFDVVG